LEALNYYPRLVLLGDPGSGKTTFVNFTALCLAGETLEQLPNIETLTSPLPPDIDDGDRSKGEEPQNQTWEHGALLPVRVLLRDFAVRGIPVDGRLATAKNLWDFIADELDVCSLGDYAPYLRKHLLEVGGLLMLDGLDEVPDANQRRVQIKRVIEDFASVYPKCRILVTSRTYAYQKQDWKLTGFSDAVLASFSKGQIRQFIERWYAHIAVIRNQKEDDALGRAELLKRTIFSNDRLRGLAERPLLLTLMASLHAWRGGALPEKREELYNDTVDLLLDWWESQRVVRNAKGEIALIQPSLAEWLEVDREKVRSLLNKLAFTVHASQTELTGTADILEDDLVSGLMHLSKNPDIKPGRLVEFLTNRAGLLLSHGVGVYTFPHRTFQEYLAACYLTDYGYPDQVANLARGDPDRWREVALLAGSKASRGGAFALWPLVDALCRNQPSADDLLPDLWGSLLAGQAILENANLEEISDANKEKVERVRDWQIQVIKTNSLNGLERARAGNTLAYLGDPRFDPQAWHLPAEPLLGFVKIPAGPFLMGSNKNDDPEADEDELDQHSLELPEYYLARYPVTVAQYAAFISDSGYKTSDEDSLRGAANHPVVWVSWYDALAYCRWLDGKLKDVSAERSKKAETRAQKAFWQGLQEGRLHVTLPSEAEWEKAARGEDGRIYPWAVEFDPQKANLAETGIGSTSTVGCFPAGASPYGILDMSGNVWEWTRSLWGKEFSKPDYGYPYLPSDGREDLDADGSFLRVLRGGSFSGDRRYARCAYRSRNNPDFRYIQHRFPGGGLPFWLWPLISLFLCGSEFLEGGVGGGFPPQFLHFLARFLHVLGYEPARNAHLHPHLRFPHLATACHQPFPARPSPYFYPTSAGCRLRFARAARSRQPSYGKGAPGLSGGSRPVPGPGAAIPAAGGPLGLALCRAIPACSENGR
jgi:formylglycine-generating enzyme required for sulfatase activity